MAQAPDGAVDSFLSRILGRSWRTSVTGLIALVCGIAPLIPGLPAVVLDVCRVALPVVAGGGLMLAKDKGVSGTAR